MAIFAPHEFPTSALDAMAAVADAVALGIERKRAERELERSQRQAEAATRAKSDFLASMSHELRTPLNAIILYSELLQEEAADAAARDVDSRPAADPVGRQPPARSDQRHPRPVEDRGRQDDAVARAVRRPPDGRTSCSTRSSPLAQKNDNTLTVVCAEDVGTMYADLMKTRQILLNLLSNAAKFTRQRRDHAGRPHARDGRRAPSVVFTVTDTGVGMTPEQSAKIFDPFTQADVTTTRKYGGTGLGLAIVSRFCQLMGGERLGREPAGRRIAVHRPAAARGRRHRRGERDRHRGGGVIALSRGMPTVMIVEDNEPSRDVLSRRLERARLRVVSAVDGPRRCRWRARRSRI